MNRIKVKKNNFSKELLKLSMRLIKLVKMGCLRMKVGFAQLFKKLKHWFLRTKYYVYGMRMPPKFLEVSCVTLQTIKIKTPLYLEWWQLTQNKPEKGMALCLLKDVKPELKNLDFEFCNWNFWFQSTSNTLSRNFCTNYTLKNLDLKWVNREILQSIIRFRQKC